MKRSLTLAFRLPYAIAQAGFVMGVLLLIGLAIVTDWTIRLVVINAKLSGRDSYTDVSVSFRYHFSDAVEAQG